MSNINVVGVQFRKAGKIYDFHGSELLLQLGDRVVVETERPHPPSFYCPISRQCMHDPAT